MYYCLLGICDDVNEILFRTGTSEHINGAQRSGEFLHSATPQKRLITYTINILILLLYLLTPLPKLVSQLSV
jgi:hypothetical protein